MRNFLALSFVLLYFISTGLSVPIQRSTYRKYSSPDGRIRRVKRNYYPTTYALLPVYGNDFSPKEQARQLQQSQVISGGLTSPDSNLLQASQSQPRNPRNYFLSQVFPYLTTENGNNLISFRRYRSPLLPSQSRSSLGDAAAENNSSDQNQNNSEENGRILGWLFGRPSYSPFPNYSMLESAAGINRYPYSARPMGMGHHGSSYVVEECTELLDPITHDIIEDCYEVPTMY